jgi:DNA-binding XRE family transcriptional regulator
MSMSGRALRIDLARTVRDVRLALGWSQRELARRSEIAQSTVCRIERAVLDDLTFDTAALILDVLGVRVSLVLQAPFIADRGWQRDAGHARCLAYVARRLRRLGWTVVTEVEIVTGSSHGWIDVLAYRESDGLLLIIEVKTDLVDLGKLQRQVSWYERAAWEAARQQGWSPRRAISAVLVLATERTFEQIEDNRELLRQSFPLSARGLGQAVKGGGGAHPAGRALAMIDPYNRSRRWLLATPLAGRVSAARYADYAAFMRRIRTGRWAIEKGGHAAGHGRHAAGHGRHAAGEGRHAAGQGRHAGDAQRGSGSGDSLGKPGR